MESDMYIIVGVILLCVTVFFVIQFIIGIVAYKGFFKADVFPLSSNPFSKEYPYQVTYSYQGSSYQTKKRRGGFPLIGKSKMIMVHKREPLKIVFVIDLVFDFFMGILFGGMTVCFFLMIVIANG